LHYDEFKQRLIQSIRYWEGSDDDDAWQLAVSQQMVLDMLEWVEEVVGL
jgi:hypothetical protein